METNWRDLIIWNEGENVGTLGDWLDDPNDHDALLDIDINSDDGSIAEWMQYFAASPGEAPDWNTPHGDTDWSGFAQALIAAQNVIRQPPSRAEKEKEMETIQHDESGWFAIGEDGYATTQYFATQAALAAALQTESRLQREQGLSPDCTPLESPIIWSY